jgi:hypothetical protein
MDRVGKKWRRIDSAAWSGAENKGARFGSRVAYKKLE